MQDRNGRTLHCEMFCFYKLSSLACIPAHCLRVAENEEEDDGDEAGRGPARRQSAGTADRRGGGEDGVRFVSRQWQVADVALAASGADLKSERPAGV